MSEKFALEFEDDGDEEIKLNGDLYATASRLSELFGISASRITQLARGGDVETEHLGRTWFIAKWSLDRYLMLGKKGRAVERNGSGRDARHR